MDVSTNNILVRFVIAVCAYFIFNVLIETVITDPKAAQIFRIILLLICLFIIFALQTVVRM